MTPDMVMFWLDNFGNDYEVLKYILTAETRHETQVWAVLNILSPCTDLKPLIHTAPGTSFDIYASVVAAQSKSVPELKTYPAKIQAEFKTHPCWIKWAAIFDRDLTTDQRKMLMHYRAAFLCLMVHGFTEAAETLLSFAEKPQTRAEKITDAILYSSAVLRKMMF